MMNYIFKKTINLDKDVILIRFLFLMNLFSLQDNDVWKEEQKLEQHSDWVRDVAWAPNIGVPSDMIASCSQVINIIKIEK